MEPAVHQDRQSLVRLEVVAFCERLAKESPLVRLGELGKSQEGRALPLLILADPGVSTPEEAARHTPRILILNERNEILRYNGDAEPGLPRRLPERMGLARWT